MKKCLMVVLVLFGSIPALEAQGGCAGKTFPPSLGNYLGGIGGGRHGIVLVFLLRFSDFGCELCLTDFLDFCDSLRAAGGARGEIGVGNVVLLFARDKNSKSYQAATLKMWAKANNINFPIQIVSWKSIPAGWFDYSTGLLIGKERRIELCGGIPMSPGLKRLIIHRLYGWTGG